jgi:hypothetical protein
MVENVEILLSPRSDWLTTGSVYYTQTIEDASQVARGNGLSLMLCGSEMVAYQGATLVGTNRYRFDKLFRGWGGSIAHAHNSGDIVYHQNGGVFFQRLTRAKIGATIYYKVQPFNFAGQGIDISSITAKQYVVNGKFWVPQIPSGLQYNGNGGKTTHFVGGGGDIQIDWKATAKRDNYGLNIYGNFGYGYSAENSVDYRVEIVGSGDVIVRSLSVNSAGFVYAEANNIADNGAWRGNVAVKVTPYNNSGLSLKTEVISLELW